MGCRAQLLPDNPVIATVSPSAVCCNNIITPVDNIPINMVSVNNSILRGKVVCGNDDTTAVPGAIVVASFVDSTDVTHYFVGVTNANGEYIICVQSPAAGDSITYSIEAYRCCCVNDPTPGDCTCPSPGIRKCK